MRLLYQDIILRDMCEADIEDDIRWNMQETEWGDWDAPWEPIEPMEPDSYRQKERERLAAQTLPGHRLEFEIDTADGVHLGTITTYCLREDFNWRENPAETEQTEAYWGIGIDIKEPAYWSHGLGAQALSAFVRYHLDGGYEHLYIQTWSGNFRMVGLAEKLGFQECKRNRGYWQVRGKFYDGLTFRLDRTAFEAYCAGVPVL